MGKRRMRMKYLSRKELIKVAEIMGIYITQDKNGWVQMWMGKPHRDDREGVWKSDVTSISRKAVIAPYTVCWKKSLISPKTKSYLEAIDEH